MADIGHPPRHSGHTCTLCRLRWHWLFTKGVAPSRQTPPRLSPQLSLVRWRFPKIRGDGFDRSALSWGLHLIGFRADIREAGGVIAFFRAGRYGAAWQRSL